jgi:ferrochelatase
MAEHFDALLVLSFGGPDRPDDVMPFLENVTRGRGVTRERLLEVAENYARLGGVSPINEQTRALIAALRAELDEHGVKLPIYWGNRNWHPFLEETIRRMSADGVRRALVFVTSAYGSYSACRQYLEDLDKAKATVGGETPGFERLPHYCLLPGFIEPLIERVSDAFAQIPEERRATMRLLFRRPRTTSDSSPTSRDSWRGACGIRSTGWSFRAVAGRRISPGSNPTCVTH